MECLKCGTTDATNWITEKVRQYEETKTSTLHTVKGKTHTLIYCPQCYEEEAINGI